MKKPSLPLPIRVILAFALTCAVSLLAVCAVSAQEIAGSVLTTDIRAYINGYEIPAYNVDGSMVILCSDLNRYGFRTVYSDASRTSSIFPAFEDAEISPLPMDPAMCGIGKKVMDVYRSDIRVIVSGRPVTAFNLDNRMAIPFSVLGVFGDYAYDNVTRTARLTIEELPTAPDQPYGDRFAVTEITEELMARMWGKSYRENCPIPASELRCLRLLYTDFDGQTQEGELVCHFSIAGTLLRIFRELYEAGYPIEKIRLVDEYDADDERSMTDNNTSCFNFRFVAGTDVPSKHGLGMAVDINPLYNPCVRLSDDEWTVEPAAAVPYADRTADFPHRIDRDDLCFRLFTEYGFEWGGDWDGVWDYQHFELPDEAIPQWYR